MDTLKLNDRVTTFESRRPGRIGVVVVTGVALGEPVAFVRFTDEPALVKLVGLARYGVERVA